jgi:hypothetical protein
MLSEKIKKALPLFIVISFIAIVAMVGMMAIYRPTTELLRLTCWALLALLVSSVLYGVVCWRHPMEKLGYLFYQESQCHVNDQIERIVKACFSKVVENAESSEQSLLKHINSKMEEGAAEALALARTSLLLSFAAELEARFAELKSSVEPLVLSSVHQFAQDKLAYVEADLIATVLAVRGLVSPEAIITLLERLSKERVQDYRPRDLNFVCADLVNSRAERDVAATEQKSALQKRVNLLKAELSVCVLSLDSSQLKGELAAARAERSQHPVGSLWYRVVDLKVQALKSALS